VAVDLGVLSGYPDFVCIAVVAAALVRGCEVGAIAGFAGGLLLDALTGQPLGLSALVYCLIGFAAGRSGERIGAHAVVRPLGVIALATMAARAGVLLLAFLLGASASLRPILTIGAVPSAALDVLLAIPAYPVVRALLRRTPAAAKPPAGTPEGVSPLVV
jgi:rod shape-determining protein MreD